MLQLYAVPQIELLKPHITLQHDGATSVPGWEISGKMDRNKRPTRLAASFPGYYTNERLHVVLRQEHCSRITSNRTDDLKKSVTDAITSEHGKSLNIDWTSSVLPRILTMRSASELYRQSGRRRSAKLVPTFAGRGVSRGQRNGSPRPLNSVFKL